MTEIDRLEIVFFMDLKLNSTFGTLMAPCAFWAELQCLFMMLEMAVDQTFSPQDQFYCASGAFLACCMGFH